MTIDTIITVGGMTTAALVGGGISRLFRVRSQNTSDDANSAHVLARAYSLLVDDLQKSVHRQDTELAELRSDLARIVTLKDGEISALRQELAHERTESSTLRARVADLERQVFKLTHPTEEA
jgi:polyhydroxyalkanoate synthesis regulator phasin